MNVLGAILAGGQARRFGSDKAHAVYGGSRLIDLVADALGAQTTALIVCGREEPGFGCIADSPEPGLGPLGGLSAALTFAETHGFAHVLTSGVDVPNVPADLLAQLSGEGAAIVASQPVVGFWPVWVAADLIDFLNEGGRALYGFADRIGARQIELTQPLLNVNRPEDLG
ncbi:MAG: molybdenum cofactor guanylyltransferase [Erythrobacter sp.]